MTPVLQKSNLNDKRLCNRLLDRSHYSNYEIVGVSDIVIIVSRLF